MLIRGAQFFLLPNVFVEIRLINVSSLKSASSLPSCAHDNTSTPVWISMIIWPTSILVLTGMAICTHSIYLR
ncbi:hypothetical protein GDO78_012903 [Eleutherodactylus coqui]|uniref:Uncharacterized protein n=1 Tax=Eleutherodactylus coqui TaxID=57060 RepID=A0A8J6EXN0_ELECQ|nr:hypothetical protein GDO78_012903 [Eleutherodactylus coqui]